MLYVDLLNTITACPFCNIKQTVIINGENAILTPSIAPYHKHHLLVIPKRHVISFLELTETEHREITKLLKTGSSLIKKLGHQNFSILIRDGSNDAKSVDHLHCHIIPNTKIGHLKEKDETREVISDDKFKDTCRELESALNEPC